MNAREETKYPNQLNQTHAMTRYFLTSLAYSHSGV